MLDWLRSAYAEADLLLRLPFHGDLSAFGTVEDVPLVSRPPSAARSVLRERLELDWDSPVVLLSFGGHGASGLPAQRLGDLTDYTFLGTANDIRPSNPNPPNVRLIEARQENYTDLVSASDVVVTKPGFGIVAGCLAERTPILYTDRGEFPEYEILVRGIHEFGQGLHIPSSELLSGNLAPYLDALLRQDEPRAQIRSDGAEVIAERLLSLLH